MKPRIIMEISSGGIEEINIRADNAAGNEQAHGLLAKCAVELRQLNQALKAPAVHGKNGALWTSDVAIDEDPADAELTKAAQDLVRGVGSENNPIVGILLSLCDFYQATLAADSLDYVPEKD